MNSHDKFCYYFDNPEYNLTVACTCEWLQTIRKDEGERIAREIEAWGADFSHTSPQNKTSTVLVLHSVTKRLAELVREKK